MSRWEAAGVVALGVATGTVTALGILYYVLKDMWR